jgi:PiT family inorganic phosphate transporter
VGVSAQGGGDDRQGHRRPEFRRLLRDLRGVDGRLAWNIITWYYGIPSSSSHALVGGLVGATVAKAGSGAPIVWEGFGKILAFIIISPLVGVIIGGLLMVLVAWIFRGTSPYQAGKFFKGGQLFAAAAYSLGHGGNDAQKTIGIIWLLMITAGVATKDVATCRPG